MIIYRLTMDGWRARLPWYIPSWYELLVGGQSMKPLLPPQADTPQNLLNKINVKYFLQNPYLFHPLSTLY